MERHHKSRKRPSINLVSLMDIFTILVFFLLVNSSTVQQLPAKKDIKLPTSVARKVPEETLIILVTQHNILVQGRRVADINQVVADNEELISGLEEELRYQGSRNLILNPSTQQAKAITIMGDENISYQVLRKILATCRELNYTRIAFAAIQKTPPREQSL
jgi:biopolymer transport protein ExbD